MYVWLCSNTSNNILCCYHNIVECCDKVNVVRLTRFSYHKEVCVCVCVCAGTVQVQEEFLPDWYFEESSLLSKVRKSVDFLVFPFIKRFTKSLM